MRRPLLPVTEEAEGGAEKPGGQRLTYGGLVASISPASIVDVFVYLWMMLFFSTFIW